MTNLLKSLAKWIDNRAPHMPIKLQSDGGGGPISSTEESIRNI